MTNIETRIQRIQERLIEIKEQIHLHLENIALLYAFADGHETLRNKGCTFNAENRQRTQEDIDRFPRTVSNLKWQIEILKNEYEALMNYGLQKQ